MSGNPFLLCFFFCGLVGLGLLTLYFNDIFLVPDRLLNVLSPFSCPGSSHSRRTYIRRTAPWPAVLLLMTTSSHGPWSKGSALGYYHYYSLLGRRQLETAKIAGKLRPGINEPFINSSRPKGILI